MSVSVAACRGRRAIRVFVALAAVCGLRAAEGDEATVKMTEWRDPYGRTEPVYDAPLAAGPLSIAPVSRRTDVRLQGMAESRGRVAVVVADGVYNSISNKLARYVTDMTSDGYTPIVYRFVSGTAEDLRGYLQGLYGEPDSLNGAVFIGDVPYIIYEYETGAYHSWACDLFFMDLDGTWTDTTENGDVHAGNGKYDTWDYSNLEIWVCRWKTSNLPALGSETGILNNYFDKNHSFRQHILRSDNTALNYADDDWGGDSISSYQAWIYGSNKCTSVSAHEATTASDYKTNRMPLRWDHIHTSSHGSPNGHGYKQADGFHWVYTSDYRDIDPPALSYILFVCSSSDYLYTNNLGSTVAFNDESGLFVVGSTKSGSMIFCEYYYEALAQEMCFGDAFVHWFNKDQQVWGPGTHFSWHAGVVMLGDASLRPSPKMFKFSLSTPRMVRKGDGTLAGAGQVSINYPLESNVVVNLVSSDASKLAVPSSVTIPAGQSSASFDITVGSGGDPEFTQTQTVQASADGWTADSAATYVEDPSVARGNCLSLDGVVVNDWVGIPSCGAIKPTGALTVESWVYVSNWDLVPTYDMSIISCTEGGGYALDIKHGSPNAIVCYVRLNGAYLAPQCPVTGLAGGWHHLALTCDGRYANLYVDGNLRDTQDAGSTYPIEYNPDNSLILGQEAGSGSTPTGGAYFKGRLDEIRIWSVARDQAEIRDDMHRRVAVDASGLGAYYKCDEPGGTTLLDSTANGNDGTLNSAGWTSSGIPFTTDVSDRTNVRAAWTGQKAALPSGRMSVTDDGVSGTNYLAFGHDNAAETENASDTPAGVEWRLNRVWQVDEDTPQTADLSFDVSGWTNAMALLVSDDGVFFDATAASGERTGDTFTFSDVAVQDGYYYTVGSVTLPAVTTAPVTDVGTTGASCGGDVTAEGSGPVTARGVCWNMGGSPTVAGAHSEDGSGTGAFASTLAGLVPGALYHVRAYATSFGCTAYGDEVTFMTATIPPGKALAFDGANDYVNVGHGAGLNLGNTLTIEAWIKPSNLSSRQGIFSTRLNNSAGSFQLEVGPGNGGANRVVVTAPGSYVAETVNNAIGTGRWLHIAYVRTAAGAGNQTLYVNGVAQTLVTDNSFTFLDNASDKVLASGTSGTQFFAGEMDEVRVWNVARTQDEIRDNMHRNLSGSEAGLAAYYPLDSGIGTSAPDVTVNGNTGTLLNGPAWLDSTVPCAADIADHTALSAVWNARTNALPSGRLTVTNANVTGDNYAVFGHDNAAEVTDVIDKPAALDWRLSRAWQVEVSGDVTADLRFDVSGLTGVLVMLVDEDGAFTNAAVVTGVRVNDTLTLDGVHLQDGFFYTVASGTEPTVTTAPVTNVTAESAQCGGTVTDAGGAPVTARGCVWSTTGSATVESHAGITADGSGAGAFTSMLSGFEQGAPNYVRAYATTVLGTTYGEERCFTSPMTPPGNCLSFDGANDYVTVPSGDDLKPTNRLSICAWVYRSSWSVQLYDDTILGCTETGGYSLNIFDNGTSDDTVGGYVRINDKYVCSGYTVSGLAGGWHHLALTYDGRNARFYLDGVLKSTRNDYADYPIQYNPTNSLVLGGEVGAGSTATGAYSPCKLDEVSIWNVCLSTTYISETIMHRQIAGNETGLVAYYNFNQTNSATLTDLTGRGHDGTLVNGPTWVPSSFPCAVLTVDDQNLRGLWPAMKTTQASGRLSLSGVSVTDPDCAVFGHDGAEETENATDKPETVNWRLNRVWRMEGRSEPTASLVFDTTGFSGPFVLLRDSDGTFDDADVVYGVTSGSTFTSTGLQIGGDGYYTLAQADLPVVTTSPASNVWYDSASCGGAVTNSGGSPVTARGIVWDTAGNPTREGNLGSVAAGSGMGSFSCAITGLTAYTTYYVRAYASNGEGTAYGNRISFATRMIPAGNCLNFDGADDHAGYNYALSPAIGDEVTVEAWVRLHNATKDSKVAGRSAGTSSVRGYTLGVIDGRLYPEAWDSALTRYSFTNGVVTAGRWTHLAMTYKRGDALIGYVDGIEVGRTNVVDRAINPASDALGIASGPDPFSHYLDGLIDEVRIWRVARTVTQIRDDMHRTLTGCESGLACYFTFDKTAGDTFPNLAANSAGSGSMNNMNNSSCWATAGWPVAVGIENADNLRAVWIARTNSLESSILTVSDGAVSGNDFAVVGHNGGALSVNYADKPGSISWRLDRAWQVEDGGVTNGALHFDCTSLDSLVDDPSYLCLLNSGTGSFAGAAIADGIYSDGVFTVTNQSLVLGNWYTLGMHQHGPYFVDASRPDDSDAGTSWFTAKRTIQAAVDLAGLGETVYVAGGTYDIGGKAMAGDFTNRVVLDKGLAVIGVDGPSHTFIVGAAGNDGGNSTGAVRCVYISDGLLSGFTITNGHTYASGGWGDYQRGGGVYLNQGGVISNCVIVGCSANITGGGVDFQYGGVVLDCEIKGNSSAYGGGGVSLHTGALLDRCVVRGNTASGNYTQDGGGLYFYSGGTARNCLIAGNWADDCGGGIYVRSTATNALAENCTVVTNVASYGGGVYLSDGTNRNCIITGNKALMEEGNNWDVHGGNPRIAYCCTSPTNGLSLYGGEGCTDADPQFTGAGDYRLQDGSPCINAGQNRDWMAGAADLDGLSRVRVGIVDMGAYEYVWHASGNALDFNGTNAYVNLGTDGRLALTNGAFTIEAWIKPAAKANICAILGHKNGGSANPGYAFYVNSWNTTDGRLKFETQSNTAGTVDPVLTWDVWQHVAVTWDGAALRFYVNGVAKAGSGNFNLTPSTVPVMLGAFSNPSSFFDGTLDEVRVWSVARSAAELQDAMHKALAGDEAGLLAYYRCDATAGTSLPDMSGHGLNGTLANGTVWTDSRYPAADAVIGFANLRGAWIAQTNSLASSILSVTNAVTTGTDFRVFGHDGGALDRNTEDKPANLVWRLDRVWQAEGDGAVVGNVSFDCSGIAGLIGNTANLRLVSGSGGLAGADTVPGVYAGDVFTVSGASLASGASYTLGEQGAPVTITATADAHGRVAPTGAVSVPYGNSTNFVVTPDTYYHVADVTTNGASVGAVTEFVWNNATADGAFDASFAADLTSHETPHPWLAQFGLTGDFEAAENSDTDSDGYTARQEYVADTDPTNSASFFAITAIKSGGVVSLANVSFLSSPSRVYTLLGCADLASGVWTPVEGAGPRLGAGGADALCDTNAPPQGPFYRVRVELP